MAPNGYGSKNKMKQNLNLKSYFGYDLHDYPESPEDLKKFVEIESQEITKMTGDEKFKRLSRLAGHYRQLREFDKVHDLFQEASKHFEKTNSQMEMINFLRWADVFRFEKKFDEALGLLDKVKKNLSANSLSDYRDFYLQHLGKLYFDRGEYKKALQCFEDALVLRKEKQITELISSTEFALKITKQKL
jgi:tetratricopeptide (TPR) repeat protein